MEGLLVTNTIAYWTHLLRKSVNYGRNPDYSAMISGITEFLNSMELPECDDADSAQKTYDTFFESLLGPEIETWGQCYKTFYRRKLQFFIIS
jgi:hypothetical protein